MLKLFPVLAVAASLILPYCGTAEAAQKVVRMSTVQSHDPHHICFMEFLKPWLEKRLGDRYKFEVYPDDSLGNYSDVYQGMVMGNVQFGMSTTSLYSQFIPEFGVLDMPYIVSTQEGANKLCSGDLFAELNGYAQKKGTYLLSMDLSSFRIFQFRKPVKTMEDMKNIKFRTTANKFHVNTIKAFGMAATPMGPTEVLTALQQGVVQGADGDNYSPIHYRWCEGAPNIVMANHMPQFYVLMGSKQWLDSIPKADREIFFEGFREYYKEMSKRLDQINKMEVLKPALEKAGCTVYVMPDEERAKLRSASASSYDLLPANLRTLCDRIRDYCNK